MAQLWKEATEYETPKTQNIADLESVSVDMDLQEKTVGEGEDAFTYKYIVVKDVEYRVPVVVLKQLKSQLEANPGLSTFRVSKEGEGLKTQYTVIPLQ